MADKRKMQEPHHEKPVKLNITTEEALRRAMQVPPKHEPKSCDKKSS